jgi:nuclear transport factor 2 (NTF2) superfamily protein
MQRENELRALYTAFNTRDLDRVLTGLTPDVDWPNGWEGGRVVGRDDVRDYWRRQWSAVDPTVEPTDIFERPDGSIEVTVHQIVRDPAGTVLSDREVRHVYTFLGDLVRRMEIEE